MPLRAQEYLSSPDYVYGCASSRIEETASTNALVSFSNAVGVSVSSKISHTLVEHNGKVCEDYVKDVGINSSLYVEGIKKDIKYNNGVYTVYYYINKSEYISSRIGLYKKNVSIAEEYEKNKYTPHVYNLMIGYMYLAYSAVDDSLLNTLYPQSVSLKKDLYQKIRSTYLTLAVRNGNAGKYWISKHQSSASNKLIIIDENRRILPGFEYYDFNGQWTQPIEFMDENGDCNNNKKTALRTLVDKTNNKFRFTYEMIVDGEFCKIDVPDEFYFCTFNYLG